MSAGPIVTVLTIIFAVAATLLVVAARFSWPPIPFYLLAGVLVGFVIQEAQLLTLAQWGIAFLVFAFAVELEPLGGNHLRGDTILVSVTQILATGLIAYLAAAALGFSELNAVVFAIAATLSSSLVTLSLMERRVRLRSLHQRLAESIHFVEDTVAVAAILLFSAYVYTDGGAVAIAIGIGLVVLGLVIRYLLFDRVVQFAGGDTEILMLTGISLIIGFVALAEYGGVSIVVGAFAAGLAVSSEYPHDVDMLDSISYLEDFFAPIFFVTVGALVTLPSLQAVLVGGLLVLAVAVLKPLITYWLLRWRGYDSRTALLTGYSLDQASEFSLIIAIEALAAGVIADVLFDAIVLATLVTMLTSVVTLDYVDRAYRHLVSIGVLDPDEAAIRERSSVPETLTDHVVVTGYDREGQQIIEVLEAIDHPYVVVESDPTREAVVRERCEHYVFGDAQTKSAWTVARATEAALLVATDPRRERTEQLLSYDLGVDTIVHAIDVKAGGDFLRDRVVLVAIPDVLVAERLRECVAGVLTGETTVEDLNEQGRNRLERAREYGPSDVRRIR